PANWTIVVATFVAATPLKITTTTLPDGAQNTPYTAQLSATGGASPYSWSVVSPDFPPGLNLDASTGAISGSPTQFGSYTFTVRVTDAASVISYRFFNVSVTGQLPISTIQTNSIEGSWLASLSLAFRSNNTAGNLIVAFVRMSTMSQTV